MAFPCRPPCGLAGAGLRYLACRNRFARRRTDGPARSTAAAGRAAITLTRAPRLLPPPQCVPVISFAVTQAWRLSPTTVTAASLQ